VSKKIIKNSQRLRVQVERFTQRRRYRRLFAKNVTKEMLYEIKFKSIQSFESVSVIVDNNLDALKKCRKSGSWVVIKFAGVRAFLWTSRYLNYFYKLPETHYTRNFRPGLINSARFEVLYQVSITSNQSHSSLNMYSNKIRTCSQPKSFQQAFYLCINGGNFFQHFIQDLLPVLSLAKNFLNENCQIPILLNKPNTNFTSFELFFNLLEIYNPKVFVDSEQLNVQELYLINFLPINAVYAIPSEMYKSAHNLIHSKLNNNISDKQNLVFVVRQELTRNFDNFSELEDLVTSKANSLGLNPIFINPSVVDITTTIEVFKNAKYVFGIHGGAMYNAIFAPINSTFIEFVTTKDTDSVSHMIRSFGINYLAYAVESGKGDSKITVTRSDLNAIFDELSHIEDQN
jgi:hypothetical protein